MQINRRTLLASGTALAGLSVLRGETTVEGAANADVPKDAVILTAMVKAEAGDQHDAYAVARWLRRRSLNDRYLDPAMTERDREAANLEGWIMGVM